MRLTASYPLHLETAWKDLAEDLASDGVRVYQMDCDNKENKKACKLAKVQSYPTIKLCVVALPLLDGRDASLLAFYVSLTIDLDVQRTATTPARRSNTSASATKSR